MASNLDFSPTVHPLLPPYSSSCASFDVSLTANLAFQFFPPSLFFFFHFMCSHHSSFHINHFFPFLFFLALPFLATLSSLLRSFYLFSYTSSSHVFSFTFPFISELPVLDGLKFLFLSFHSLLYSFLSFP